MVEDEVAVDEDYNPAGFMDPAFILTGCDRSQGYYPVYRTNDYCQKMWGTDCTYGEAWYCNDDRSVEGKYDDCNDDSCAHLGGGDFDPAYIHHGCSGCGVCKNNCDDDCVYYTGSMWKCNDASDLAEDKEENKMLRGEVAVE